MVVDEVREDSAMPRKMEYNYESEVTAKLAETDALAQSGAVQEAIDALMGIEKQARAATDVKSTARILVACINYCFNAQNWALLNDHVVLMTKKRGQLKGAVRKMVQEAMTFVPKIDDKQTKLDLIDTLRSVTAGKIYVEVERARLTKTLTDIKERDGEVVEAANILQELQVETFGSMEKREKVEFILEQMRLCLLKGDTIRTAIISKKISTKYFANEDVQGLKLTYYNLMVKLAVHEDKYLDVSRYYTHILNTQATQTDSKQTHDALMNASVYAVLAPFDAEQHELIRLVHKDKRIDEVPVFKELLDCFITNEVLSYNDFTQTFSVTLQKMDVFARTGSTKWEVLRSRIIEHNVRIVSKYYTQMTFARFCELLSTTEEEAEAVLSRLVVQETIHARIDRPAGCISFRKATSSVETLNEWSASVNKLMALVDTTIHDINKEEMIARIKTKK